MEDRRNINLNTNNKEGLYKMIENIFKSVVFAQRDCHTQMDRIRQQGWEIFETFKNEYLKSMRPRLFLRLKTSEEVLIEANNYALKQMQIFLNGFVQQQDKLVSTSIEISQELPKHYLTSIKGILAEEAGDSQLQEPGSAEQYAIEEILKKMAVR
jgi:hypothetical protein